MQETGRAGRDGKTAVCILYYSYGDAVRMRHMLKQSAEEQSTSPAQLQCNMDSLNQMARSCSPALTDLQGNWQRWRLSVMRTGLSFCLACTVQQREKEVLLTC